MDASCIITETVTFGVPLPLRSNECTRGKPDNKAKTIEHIKVYSFHVALFRSLITLDSQLKRRCGCRNIHAFAVKLAGELVILSGKICVSFYFPRLGYPGRTRSCEGPRCRASELIEFREIKHCCFLGAKRVVSAD